MYAHVRFKRLEKFIFEQKTFPLDIFNISYILSSKRAESVNRNRTFGQIVFTYVIRILTSICVCVSRDVCVALVVCCLQMLRDNINMRTTVVV